MLAERRTWRERRDDNWSQTEYSGLYIPDDLVKGGLLISELSHGLVDHQES